MNPPRRWRMFHEDLEEKERRKIEKEETRKTEDVKTTKIIVGLPAAETETETGGERRRRQHLILVNDMTPPFAPPGHLKSAVFFSSFDSIVVGSVNGLICIAGSLLHTRDDIWIMNPVNECCSIKLPLPASPTLFEHFVSFAFYWDSDSKKNNFYKVFKVVTQYKFESLGEVEIDPYSKLINLDRPVVSNRLEVWDSRTPNTWTEIKNFVFPHLFYHPGEQITSCEIVVKKVAFWILARADGLGLFLLTINMETHAVKQIPLPKPSIPIDVLTAKLMSRFMNPYLFGALWEGSFALIERLSFNKRLFNAWVIDKSGASLFKKATFLVDFGLGRFICCVNGKLLVEQARGLSVLFDMETRKGEVIVAPTFMPPAHDFVRTNVSISGSTPIRSFPSCPEFTIFWPDLEEPLVIEPPSPSVAVPPTCLPFSVVKPSASVNVSPLAAKASVPSAKPVGAPASNEAPNKTYASLVAEWTLLNSPKAPSVPLANGAPKPLASVTKVTTKSMARGKNHFHKGPSRIKGVSGYQNGNGNQTDQAKTKRV